MNYHKVSLERIRDRATASGERIRKGTTATEQVVKRRMKWYEDSEKNIEKLNPKSRRKRS